MKKTPAFLLAALLLGIQPAQAFSVRHDFSVQIGPFDASRTNFEYALTPTEYRVESTVKTNGLFDTLYPFRADYATTGKINGDNMETRSYKYKSQSRFTSRSRELVYDRNGKPLYRLSAKNGKEKKVDILPDAKNKDTTDLQTVFAELARQYNRFKFCDSRMEVFDGKRRYDVIFKDEGKELLNDETLPYKGEAVKCSMYIDSLGSSGDDLLWDVTQDEPIYFWIMEDGVRKLPFIAKIEIDSTPLGRLQVLTQNITIKDYKPCTSQNFCFPPAHWSSSKPQFYTVPTPSMPARRTCVSAPSQNSRLKSLKKAHSASARGLKSCALPAVRA